MFVMENVLAPGQARAPADRCIPRAHDRRRIRSRGSRRERRGVRGAAVRKRDRRGLEEEGGRTFVLPAPTHAPAKMRTVQTPSATCRRLPKWVGSDRTRCTRRQGCPAQSGALRHIPGRRDGAPSGRAASRLSQGGQTELGIGTSTVASPPTGPPPRSPPASTLSREVVSPTPPRTAISHFAKVPAFRHSPMTSDLPATGGHSRPDRQRCTAGLG